MSKPDAWMPLYVGDYLADTARLTTAQHGAYLLLLMDYWRNGPLPDDDGILAQVAKASAIEWRKLRPIISSYFRLIEGRWTHKRVEEELHAATERSDKAEDKARKAALIRWGKDAPSIAPSIAPSTPQAMLKECPSPSPSSLKEKPTPLSDSPSANADVVQIDRKEKGERRQQAHEILRFLNEHTGHHYRLIDVNVDPIMARLREASAGEVRAVIVRKAREWKDDPHWKKFLRPDTLFNRTKFHQYLGEVPPPEPQHAA